MSQSVVGRVAGRCAAVCALALLPIMLLPIGSAHAGPSGSVSSVEVVQTPQGTAQVILVGAQDAMYTAFMRENPRRLIIDLPEVDFDGVHSPIAVGQGLVSDVTWGAFGDAKISPTTARVSIGLDGEAEYELEPQADRLVVTFKPVALAEAAPPAGSSDSALEATASPPVEIPLQEAKAPAESPPTPEAAPPAEAAASVETLPASGESRDRSAAAEAEVGSETEPPTSDAPVVASSAPAPTPRTRIVGISEQGTSITIESDSPLEKVDSFVLDDPDRIVIDLEGATSAVWPATQNLARGPVERIRVGEHADKVRVVLDLRTPVEAHTLFPDDHGVRVDLQSTAEVAEPDPTVADSESLPASPAPTADEAGAPEPMAQVADVTPAASPTEVALVSDPEQAESEVRLREDDPGAGSTNEVQLRDDPVVAPTESASPDAVVASTEATAPESVVGIAESASPEPELASSESDATDSGVESSETDASDATAASSESASPEAAVAPGESRTAGPSAEPETSIEVRSIHFESLPDVDRLVVTLSSPADAQLIQPDPATVIVDLPGVAIDPVHERRVDTSDFGGPVEVFSAFRSPEIPGANVRVAIKRKGDASPRLDWQGSQLRIEFPHASGMAQAPAAEPAHGAAPASVASVQEPVAPPSSPALAAPGAETPGAPGSLPGGALDDADEFGGPAQPAAIDLLEEGGFSRSKSYQGRHISLDFEDAEIGNILRMIAEVSNLNVIAGEEVKGKVSIRMVDVPWDQALDVVLLTKGLGFLRIGNILRIAPVDVLHQEEEARLQERRAKEKLEDLVVKLQPVNYANVDEIKDLVSHLLSPRGTVNVDSRTSTLILKDIPTVIQEATALVKAIDTATPQVLIEAKIVEASLDFSRALGATWGTKLNPSLLAGAEDRALRLGDSSTKVIPSGGSGLTQATSFVSANPIAAAVGTLSLGLLSFADRLQLDLAIQAAESKNKGKVVSSPRVVTLDNREATIQQGVAIAFTSSTADSVNTTFVDAVLELQVTPHITADKSIIMKIKVSRNAPDLSASTGTVQGITKNETETEALVRDGQTLVLGGIYTVDKSHSRSMMPYLADVPVIGVAFRSTTHKDVRKELLVFVTPRIVRGVTDGG